MSPCRATAWAWACAALLGCGDTAPPARLLVFGIDGAGFALTRQLMADGELPHLADLARRGSFGPLRSIEPMLSPALWTSIATGKRRERHGILGFTAGGGAAGVDTLHTSELLRGRRLWDVLGDAGRSVGVVNWWVTWPVTPVRGFLVSNLWPTSENMIRELRARNRGLPGGLPLAAAHFTSTWPPELRGEIDRFIVEEVDERELSALHLSRENYAYIWDLPETKSRTAAGLHLYQKHRPDAFFIYYWILDHVQHQYAPGDPVPVRRVYHHLDEILGRFVALAGDDALVAVLSDHGFRARRGPRGARAEHGPLGILCLAGPGVRAGAMPANAGILDVAPTLLAALGLPTARDMDGRALSEVLEPRFLEAHPVRSVASYDDVPPPEPVATDTAPFEPELKRRLRALGYLDAEPTGP